MTQQLITELVPEWTLGDRLRKARELTGLDAAQFAEAIGVHRDTIANYEKAKVRPRQIVLRAWAMRTGVSLLWLETGESPRPAGGPNGGGECAIRDSNPEPAGSVAQARMYEFSGNGVHDPRVYRRLAAVAEANPLPEMPAQQWADDFALEAAA